MSISVKQQLNTALTEILVAKLDELSVNIASTQESRDSDTKSSAGDKFETSREMAQIELNNLGNQADKTARLMNELRQTNTKSTSVIGYGSLVTTNQGIYYLSIPFGKIKLKETEYFVISMASPIGQNLNGKSVGDDFSFNGKRYEVLSIL